MSRDIPIPAAGCLIAVAFFALFAGCGDGDNDAGANQPVVATPSSAGSLSLVKDAQTAFAEDFIVDPTAEEKEFMRTAYAEFRGYPPFHDQALRWGPPTDFYQDLYAIFNDDRTDGSPNRQIIEDHPDWVLRDAAGEPLYIPFACAEGSCPAFAADPGDAEWRDDFIRRARVELEKGYEGLYIDNVNLLLRVGNGAGVQVAPIDPRTGEPMTLQDWRGYVADFVEEIRRRLPGTRISHNSIWYAPRDNPEVQRALEAADRIEIERGLSDPGLVPGDGPFGYETMLGHVDFLHGLDKSIITQPYDLDPVRRRFEVASLLLVTEPGDLIASDLDTDPSSYWAGWEIELGAPLGPRYEWDGLFRRDFEKGTSLVNPPGAVAIEVELDSDMTDLEGVEVSDFELAGGSGTVLSGNPGSPESAAPVEN